MQNAPFIIANFTAQLQLRRLKHNNKKCATIQILGSLYRVYWCDCYVVKKREGRAGEVEGVKGRRGGEREERREGEQIIASHDVVWINVSLALEGECLLARSSSLRGIFVNVVADLHAFPLWSAGAPVRARQFVRSGWLQPSVCFHTDETSFFSYSDMEMLALRKF